MAINVSQAERQMVDTADGARFPWQEEAASRMPDEYQYTGGFTNAWKAQGATAHVCRRLSTVPYRRWICVGKTAHAGLPFPVNGHGLLALEASSTCPEEISTRTKISRPTAACCMSLIHQRIAGWRRLPDCPGTPRVGHRQRQCGKSFVLGGTHGRSGRGLSGSRTRCWCVWTRLPDIPLPNQQRLMVMLRSWTGSLCLSVGLRTSTQLLYRTIRKALIPTARPSYQMELSMVSQLSGVTASSNPNTPGITYWGYNNGVLVFDAQLNKWGTINATSVDSELIGQTDSAAISSNVCLPRIRPRGQDCGGRGRGRSALAAWH